MLIFNFSTTERASLASPPLLEVLGWAPPPPRLCRRTPRTRLSLTLDCRLRRHQIIPTLMRHKFIRSWNLFISITIYRYIQIHQVQFWPIHRHLPAVQKPFHLLQCHQVCHQQLSWVSNLSYSWNWEKKKLLRNLKKNFSRHWKWECICHWVLKKNF